MEMRHISIRTMLALTWLAMEISKRLILASAVSLDSQYLSESIRNLVRCFNLETDPMAL